MRRSAAAAVLVALAGCAASALPPQASPPDTRGPAFPKVAPPIDFPKEGLSLEGVATQGGVVRGRSPPGWTGLQLRGPNGEETQVPLAADGSFIIGFDRDAARYQLLVSHSSDGTVALPIEVASRAWRIEQVDAPLLAGRTTAEFDRLRPIELSEIAAARAPDPRRPDPGGWRTPLAWPGQGRVSGLFGAQRVYRGEPGSYHSGIDLALPAGTPVLAPADGIVTLAADRSFTLEGRLLLVDHGGGLESAFLHLSRIDVVAGQRVRRGEPIGRVGATGRATGPHLHWGLRWRGARLDPLLVADARGDERTE